jgi:hypothetical protein
MVLLLLAGCPDVGDLLYDVILASGVRQFGIWKLKVFVALQVIDLQ